MVFREFWGGVGWEQRTESQPHTYVTLPADCQSIYYSCLREGRLLSIKLQGQLTSGYITGESNTFSP